MQRILAVAVLCAATWLQGNSAGWAQESPVEANLGPEVTVEELIERLSPPKRTRGIEVAPTAPSLSLDVGFRFDSAVLVVDAKQLLTKLAIALNSRTLSDTGIVIEGHTDAAGPEPYNLQLSERRALSVRDYLIMEGGVRTNRLIAVGKGETLLKDPDNPESAVNRRVVLRVVEVKTR